MKITVSQLKKIIVQETRNLIKEGPPPRDPQLEELIKKRFGGLLIDMQGEWDDPRIKDAIMARFSRMLDGVLANLAVSEPSVTKRR